MHLDGGDRGPARRDREGVLEAENQFLKRQGWANTSSFSHCPNRFFKRKGGEKSVRTRKVESMFSVSLPFSSDFSLTLFHSGSS